MENRTKKVMVFGTFDIIHPGHINFLKQAKKHGNHLTIVIARDQTVKQVKSRLPLNNENKRQQNIIKTKLADQVVLGNLDNKYKIIKQLKPDIICLGYDQIAFTEKLEEKLEEFNLNCKIIKLKPYQPEKYKSSKIVNRQQ